MQIGAELYRYLRWPNIRQKADAHGRITLAAIVPGLKFYVEVRKDDNYFVGEPRIRLLELKPGEARDLGDRKLTSEK